MATLVLHIPDESLVQKVKQACKMLVGVASVKVQKAVSNDQPTEEELQAHRELRDAALEHSRKSMASIIARYL